MKSKGVWAVVASIIVVIAGAIWYTAAHKNNTASYSQSNASENATTINNQPTPATMTGGYVDYNADVFANTQGQRWLFFYAPWCPQCRALEKDIHDHGVPDGVTVFKVDYDSETTLKKKYGVTIQTTVVNVDDQGNEIEKFVAYDDPTISAVMNALGG